MDAIGPRQAVGAGHDDVVEARVTVDGRQAAAERPRRDRRDVVDEPLGGQFSEFDAHVTAHGDHMIPLGRKDRVEHPVFVGALIEHLFPGLHTNRPQAVIGAAKRDQGAVGRPRATIDGVERHGHRPHERAVGHVPDLHLAHPRRVAAGDRKFRAVGREAHPLDALSQADQSPDRCLGNGTFRHVEQEHLVEPRDGQQGAVG